MTASPGPHTPRPERLRAVTKHGFTVSTLALLHNGHGVKMTLLAQIQEPTQQQGLRHPRPYSCRLQPLGLVLAQGVALLHSPLARRVNGLPPGSGPPGAHSSPPRARATQTAQMTAASSRRAARAPEKGASFFRTGLFARVSSIGTLSVRCFDYLDRATLRSVAQLKVMDEPR